MLARMSSCTLYASSPDWLVSCEILNDLLLDPRFRLVKKTSRTVAGIAELNGIEVFIKRVTNDSWLKGIIARVCGSRARKALRGGAVLQRAGFPHPRLIAAFEQHRSASVHASYVILEYLRRPKTLSRFALADGRDFNWRCRLSKHVAGAISALHAAGCYTRDLQETNLMLEANSDELKVYFTDLEDFRWLPIVPWRVRLNNLIQLDRSIGRFVSRTHRLRFVYNYLGSRADRSAMRWLIARLEKKRRRIEKRKLNRSRVIITPPDITTASMHQTRKDRGRSPANHMNLER